jgi:hypothetical protein
MMLQKSLRLTLSLEIDAFCNSYLGIYIKVQCLTRRNFLVDMLD